MPKVSVTIPTYNRAGLVAESIQSVLKQTFEDFELIVIDDGSTDHTREVVTAISDPRLVYVYQDNRGCAGARNTGLDRCTGDAVAFFDSDDLWPTDFLEVMLKALQEAPDVGCVYCSIEKFFPDGTRQDSYGPTQCKSGWITEELFKSGFIWIQAALFRREVLDGFRFDDTMRNAADTDALLRLSTKIQYHYIPEIKVLFRAEHGVADRKDHSKFNCNRIRVLERFYYRLGGDRYVSRPSARKKLSHAYRRVARNYTSCDCRHAALMLYKKAIAYWPLDWRLYMDYLKAAGLSKTDDPAPDWTLPEPLADISPV
jgi:glycosyltransferase involved in cell wall biosynthesis